MEKSLLQHITALLISNPTNILYLTGFIGASPEEREAYVLVTEQTVFLFTNSLYIEQARKIIQLSNQQINTNYPIKRNVIELSREKPLTKAIQEILQAVGSDPQTYKIGFEDTDLTVAEYQKLRRELTSIELVPTRNRVEALRTYKLADEIGKIKKACQLTDECFEYIQKMIKPGISELDIAWEIEVFFKKNGASNAFSPIVAFGKNASMPHYTSSTSCKLQANSSILIDFGAKVDGYCADMTRMLFLGKPNIQLQKVYETLKKAQQTAVDLLIKGERSGATLDTAVREVLTTNGLTEYSHSLGHGIGLAVHENPRLTNKFDMTLKPGMVFSVEPGVYVSGKFGMRIEDLVYIREDNTIEILSKASKELTSLPFKRHTKREE